MCFKYKTESFFVFVLDIYSLNVTEVVMIINIIIMMLCWRETHCLLTLASDW